MIIGFGLGFMAGLIFDLWIHWYCDGRLPICRVEGRPRTWLVRR